MPRKAKKEIKPVEKKEVTPKAKYVYTIGRRKSATARVRLFSGKGETLVNDKPIADYFPGEIAKTFYLGSGKNSQLTAVVHGLSRALDKDNKEIHHPALKINDLLTRDPRERERRKPGLGGKARRHKQSPKR